MLLEFNLFRKRKNSDNHKTLQLHPLFIDYFLQKYFMYAWSFFVLNAQLVKSIATSVVYRFYSVIELSQERSAFYLIRFMLCSLYA